MYKIVYDPIKLKGAVIIGMRLATCTAVIVMIGTQIGFHGSKS